MPLWPFAQRSPERTELCPSFSRPGKDPSVCYVSLVSAQQPRMYLSSSKPPPIGGYLTLFKLLVASLLREVRAAPALAARSGGLTSGAGVGAAGASALLWKRADEELTSQGELLGNREGTLKPNRDA